MPERRRLPRVPRAQLAELLREAERYLAAVDALRAEGCEPSWRTT